MIDPATPTADGTDPTPAATTPAATAPAATVTVTLGVPIAREGGAIGRLTLRRPVAGDLRGLSMQDVVTAQADAVLRLVPRLAEPAVLEVEVAALDAADFAEVAGTVAGFFMTPAQIAMVQAMSTR